MARFELLPDPDSATSLAAWERSVSVRKRMVQIFGGLIFLGVMAIEFQTQFTGNPAYLFLLVFAMVLVWVLSDYMTSKVERVKSDHDWALLEERDKRKAAEK